MRVVIQRCSHAECVVDRQIISSISSGMMVLVGFGKEDTEDDIDFLIHKIVHLRIFSDENGKINKSIKEVRGQILAISQFTLYADLKKGNRPSFTETMPYDEAKRMYDVFIRKLKEHVEVFPGVFGADMKIDFVNDGPVTICLDSKNVG